MNTLKRFVLAATLPGLLLAWVPTFATPPVYPLQTSANGRYLVDQHNTPVMIVTLSRTPTTPS